MFGVAITFFNYSAMWLTELGDSDFRNYANMSLQMGASIAEVIWVIIGYYVRDWQALLVYATGVPSIIMGLLMLVQKESPLYLLSMKKYERFKATLEYTAKCNKKLKDLKEAGFDDYLNQVAEI